MMDLTRLLFFSSISFLISFLLFPVEIKVLTQWKWFGASAEHRIHQGFRPSMGGVCIVLGIAFTLLIALPLSELSRLKYFFISLALMFITGLRDDLLALKPRQKLIGQILPIVILVIFGDTVLTSFYGSFSELVFPRMISLPLTIFTIIILTNSYNLIDGIDGLAGTIAALVLVSLATWFFAAGDQYLSLVCFSFAGSVLAFLVYNWQPSRIFMGDTGALSIGLVLSFLAIQFINLNSNLPLGHLARFQASIGTAICILIIPIFDTARVIILRLGKWRSPLHADTNHLHHRLLKLGFSHAQTVLLLGGTNVLFIGLALILRNQKDQVILPVVAGLCLMVNQILNVAQRKYAKNSGESGVLERGN